MLTVSLTDTLESAVLAAAHRAGMSVDDYVAAVCTDALSLEIDRARLDSYLAGTPAVSQEAAQTWLSDLSAGHRTECPR